MRYEFATVTVAMIASLWSNIFIIRKHVSVVSTKNKSTLTNMATG